jgi:hypothetical protein
MEKLPKRTRFLLEVLLNNQLGEIRQRDFTTHVETNSNKFVTCMYKTQDSDTHASFFLNDIYNQRESYVETNFSFSGTLASRGITLYNEYVDKHIGALKDVPEYVTISNEKGVLLYKGGVGSLSAAWKSFIYDLKSHIVAKRAISDLLEYGDYTF